MRQIENIERTWHKAASKKNLDLMMSIWAPNATMTIGGKTYTGKPAIRALLAKAGPFQPQNHWISDTAAYKIRVTVNGSKGTLSGSPLHRRRHAEGGGRSRRRPGGAEAQRTLVDHRPHGQLGDAEPLRT